MIRKEEPWLTKLCRWWLNHYNESIQFWVGMHWCLVIFGFIFGAFNSVDLGVVMWSIFCIGVFTNSSLYVLMRMINWHLKNNITDEQKPEFYELMKNNILYKITWRY
jgi:hypothetical protein